MIAFFHNDVAARSAVATEVNGIQAWKDAYRSYGDQLVDSSAAQNNKLWSSGKSFDDSAGLSYMGARSYDPTLGRFMAYATTLGFMVFGAAWLDDLTDPLWFALMLLWPLVVTFALERSNVLLGAVHLLMFVAYLVLLLEG